MKIEELNLEAILDLVSCSLLGLAMWMTIIMVITNLI